MNIIEAWDEVAEALHQFHPQSAWQVGKGICEYRPCQLARDVAHRLRELDYGAAEEVKAKHLQRLQAEDQPASQHPREGP